MRYDHLLFSGQYRGLGADFSHLQLHGDISTEFYDPVFSPEDEAYLTSQGHSVLSGDVS